MIDLTFDSLDKFAAHIEKWVDDVKEETAQVANGMAVEMFNHLLQISPQYSGDFAANWQYSLNTPNRTFTPLNLLDQQHSHLVGAYKAGDLTAINYAKVMNKGRDAHVKLGDTIYLSNSAAHDEPYALKIENNQIKFRFQVGNSGKVVERTLAALAPSFTSIGALSAKQLRRKKL